MLTRLGQGSFGTVHKVRRRADNNIYVMKLIPIGQMDSRGQQDSINEVTILASLNHPYIVKYYDSFIENKTLHIVMEFCDKGDLCGVIRAQMGRLLPEAKIWKFLIQMCLGLEYIHSKRILHRDIKTMNVFLAREDSLRIGDLGVAKKLISTAAFAHTMVGTPYYLSPELCEDKPYNIKSDMWALGCVLYELCTLKHPFDANNQGALFMKIIRAAYTPVTGQYSSELKQLVDLCLSKDYKKRPSAATILSRPGMRERAMALSIAVPEGSILSGSALQLTSTPPEVNRNGGGKALVAEEEKNQKRVPEERRRPSLPAPKVVVGPKAHQELGDPNKLQPPSKAEPRPKGSPKPPEVPRPKADQKPALPKPGAIPFKPHDVAPQRVRKGAPNAISRNAQQQVMKTPSMFPPGKQAIAKVGAKQPAARGPNRNSATQEELDEIKQVLNLPEYSGKKKPNVSDIRQDTLDPKPSPEPWKSMQLAGPSLPSNPPVYDPSDLHEDNPSGSDSFEEVEVAGIEVRTSQVDPEEEEAIPTDTLQSEDWNLSHTEGDWLPTYQSDDAHTKKFAVNYVETVKEVDEEEMFKELEDEEFVSSEEEEETDSSTDSRAKLGVKRDILADQIRVLTAKIATKRAEVNAKVGSELFLELYSFFRSAMDSPDATDIEQSSIDAFVYSKLTGDNYDVSTSQVVQKVYQILSMEVELRDYEEAVKALNFELL